MSGTHKEHNRTYTIYGTGAWNSCSVVQARLSEHGICSYTGWAPSPPFWRFKFDTYMSPAEIHAALGDLWDRYQVRVER